MTQQMYAIFDKKVNAFLQPFFMATYLAALRALEDLLSDPTHQFYKHASDFSLHLLGEYDDQTGLITPNECGAPLLHIHLNELLQQIKRDTQTTINSSNGIKPVSPFPVDGPEDTKEFSLQMTD